ncbi:hypothetical protein HDU92_003218 [Lobulomyces angularis]|nr:hypothetical protein HDU92_003218 [Lobulomyces angularis]
MSLYGNKVNAPSGWNKKSTNSSTLLFKPLAKQKQQQPQQLSFNKKSTAVSSSNKSWQQSISSNNSNSKASYIIQNEYDPNYPNDYDYEKKESKFLKKEKRKLLIEMEMKNRIEKLKGPSYYNQPKEVGLSNVDSLEQREESEYSAGSNSKRLRADSHEEKVQEINLDLSGEEAYLLRQKMSENL